MHDGVTAASAAEPHAAGDDHLHDLVGAGVDRLHGGVGVVRRDRVLEHEAVAAVELQAVGGEALLQVGRPPLRHADLGDDVVAAHVRHEQLVDERLADLDLRRQLGELELRVLERGDRLAEGVALLHVGDRVVERAPARGDRRRPRCTGAPAAASPSAS